MRAEVGPEDAGLRIDRFLAREMPVFSRSAWQKRLADGRVKANGQVVRQSYRVRPGDRFSFHQPAESEPPVARDLRVLSVERGLTAVYKPSPLPMHENGPYRHNTFAVLVQQLLGEGWTAVHRLDRETSGIVICAQDAGLRRDVASCWAAGGVSKTYLAICRGEPGAESWTASGPIGDLPDSEIRIKRWVVADGLAAETAFSVQARARGHALLTARPRTGRTHQIRVHAAHAGLPLVGDKLYHPDEAVFLAYHELGDTPEVQAPTGHARLALHATQLILPHPRGGRWRVDCPLADDLAQLWAGLATSAGD